MSNNSDNAQLPIDPMTGQPSFSNSGTFGYFSSTQGSGQNQSTNNSDGFPSDAYLNNMRQEDLERIQGQAIAESTGNTQTSLEAYANSPSSVSLGDGEAGALAYTNNSPYVNNNYENPPRYDPVTGGNIYDSGAESFSVLAPGNIEVRQLPDAMPVVMQGSTLQIGIGGSTAIGVLGGVAGAGVAIDTRGNIALYGYGGGGGAAGVNEGAGLSIQVSNVATVNDLSGPFTNTSLSGGLVVGATIDQFSGSSDHGVVTGVGVTLGEDVGVSGFAGKTFTWVSSSINPLNFVRGFFNSK